MVHRLLWVVCRGGGRATGQTVVLAWLLMGGTLAMSAVWCCGARVLPPVWGVECGVAVLGGWRSTLLGPEGTGALGLGLCGLGFWSGWVWSWWVVSASDGQRWVGVAAGSGIARLYFENCTVDASIFVAKLVRAYGECLGTRSR